MVKNKMGGVQIVIYIIGHEKYLDYYGNSLLKYPLKIYRPNFRARRIARISNSQKEVGSIVGLNLRVIDYMEEKSLNSFIKNLKTIKLEGEETLYMEEGAEIPLASLERIEGETDLIINFWDNYPLKQENLKESTLIFDYSWEKPFKRLKNNMVIRDFNFQLKDDKLDLNPLIGSKLNSALYELISGDWNGKIHQLEINGSYYNLSSYLKGRLKGRNGHF